MRNIVCYLNLNLFKLALILNNLAIHLQATPFIDSDHIDVINFAHSVTQNSNSTVQKVVDIYYAVRDEVLYDPYHISLNPDNIKASLTLQKKSGYCIEKSLLMAAAARVLGIPSLLGFANVRNHLASEKFVQLLGTNLFVYHGYVSVYVNNTWVKATPAFNKTMCQKFKVPPLEFDGLNDSIFQQYDADGKQFMDYVEYHGEFADFPYQKFVAELQKHYFHLFEK